MQGCDADGDAEAEVGRGRRTEVGGVVVRQSDRDDVVRRGRAALGSGAARIDGRTASEVVHSVQQA